MSMTGCSLRTLYVAYFFLRLIPHAQCLFVPTKGSSSTGGWKTSARQRLNSSLFSSYRQVQSPQQQVARDTILRRNGRYFNYNRFSGKVEFGTTIAVTTCLEKASESPLLQKSRIHDWIMDSEQVASSIWDRNMIRRLSRDHCYRLQLMTLQFVTIQLTPTVDTLMWTETGKDGIPVFQLQSVDFDPNIQILPGVGVSANSLGIQIVVVGELRPSMDGKGVTGKIGFVSSGVLPPPLMILPDFVLEGAAETISKTTGDFVIKSFQLGATRSYRDFCKQMTKNVGISTLKRPHHSTDAML